MARQRNPQTGELMVEGISAVVSPRTGAVTFRSRVTYTDGGGKRRFRGKTFKAYDAAVEWKLETELRIRRGTFRDDSPMTVAEFFEEWMPRKARSLAPSTARRYREAWRIHIAPEIGARRLSSLTRGDLQRLVDHLLAKPSGRSDGTLRPGRVRYIMAIVTGMLGTAVVDGIIQINPSLNLDLPALDTAPTRTWSSLQIRRFLAGTRETASYPMWLFLVTTCARIGETLALRAGDIHLAPDESGSSTVWLHRTARETGNGTTYDEGTKTSKTGRTVRIEPALVAVLAPLVDAKPPDAFVFTDEHGCPFTHHRIQSRFTAAIAQLGLPRITLHGLRHSAASLMVANGVPDGIVKSILGHRSVLTTIDTYAHISPGMQRIGTTAIHELLGLAEDTTTSLADEAKS